MQCEIISIIIVLQKYDINHNKDRLSITITQLIYFVIQQPTIEYLTIGCLIIGYHTYGQVFFKGILIGLLLLFQ